MSLLDARGVLIAAGETVIFGFGVGRCIAMAEAVVLPEEEGFPYPSQTKTGRIRLRVVRRSHYSGEKPVVDVAPDRLVVLKPCTYGNDEPFLPPSPLPTQFEGARAKIEASIARSTEALRETRAPHWWVRGDTSEDLALAEYHEWHTDQLKKLRRKLRELDEQA
jgi:hypothetical protein